MNELLSDEPSGEFRHLGSKRSDQRSCGDLEEAAGLDQLRRHVGPSKDCVVAFGMGKDCDNPGGTEGRQEPVERQVDFVGQFQEYMALSIGQGEHFSASQLVDYVGLDSDVGSRQHLERNIVLAEKQLQLGGLGANFPAAVPPVAAQLVGGCHDG
jgi:hypothetical protein